MRDRSRHQASEWSQESPTCVTPHAFDALCRVLGRTVAQSMQQHSVALPAPLLGPKGGKSPGTPENVRALPYQWAARHLLAKMGVEAR
jgi:hypothetical protein